MVLTLKSRVLRMPAAAGPAAIPKALALTKAAELAVRMLKGTWSEMYRLLIALAPPRLRHKDKRRKVNS